MTYSAPRGGIGFWSSAPAAVKAPEPINSRAEDYKSPGDNSSPAGDNIPAGIGAGSYEGKIDWWNDFRLVDNKVTASFVMLFVDCIFTDSFSLVKMFADERPLISNLAPLKQTSQKVRFYDGTQTTPDPLLVSKLGEDKASAWPGFAYAVFEDFDCTDYGNRVPLIRTVLSGAVTSVVAGEEPSTLTFGEIDSAYGNNFFTADPLKNQAYIYYWNTFDDGYVSVIDIGSNVEINRAFVTETNYSLFEYMVALPGTDYFVCTVFPTSGDQFYEIALVNAFTGDVVARTPALEDGGNIFEMLPHSAVMIESGAATKFVVFTGPYFGFVEGASYLGALVVDVTSGTLKWVIHPWLNAATGTNNAYSIAIGPVEGGACTFYYAESFDNAVNVYKGSVSGTGFATSLFYSEEISGVAGGLEFACVAYDRARDEVLVYWSYQFPALGSGMRKLDASGAVLWSVANPQTRLAINYITASYDHFFYVARPGYVIAAENGGDGDVYEIDLSNGRTTLVIDKDQFSNDGHFGYFNQIAGVYVEDGPSAGIVNRITLGDTSPNTVGLVDIITQIYGAAEIPAEDLAFTDVTDEGVYGLKLENDTTFENLLQSVVEPFDVKVVESDGTIKLKGARRDGAFTVDVEVAPEHFVEDGTRTIEKTIGAREEEFAGCSVSYFDRDADYKKLDQEYNRPIGVYDVTRSRKKRTINTVLSLTASQAMQLATLAVYRSVLGNESYTGALVPALAHVEPGDIVQFDFRGFTTVARISEASLNADYTQGIQAYQYLQYADATFTGAALDEPAAVTASTFARLMMLDIPLLSAADDLGGAGLVQYALPIGFGPAPLSSASVYRSRDEGGTYSVVGSRSGIAPVTGIVTAISGTPSDPFVKDTTHTIAVRVTSGDIADLATITSSQFTAGKNLAAIGRNGQWVLLWFQTVASASGTATLSNLMWGVRGSEVWIGSLQVGDQFVLLKSDQYIRFREALADLDDTNYYRIAYGSIPLGASPTTAFAPPGVAETPYAPVNLSGELVGSDVLLEWDYRSRVASGLNPTNHGEASLAFEIDVMDGATVKRTLTATANSKTYLAADVVTDFGSTPVSLKVRVYMMSAVVGRGYMAQATIPLSGFSTADSTIVTADSTVITADTA